MYGFDGATRENQELIWRLPKNGVRKIQLEFRSTSPDGWNGREHTMAIITDLDIYYNDI